MFLALIYLNSVQAYSRIYNCTEFPLVNSVLPCKRKPSPEEKSKLRTPNVLNLLFEASFNQLRKNT